MNDQRIPEITPAEAERARANLTAHAERIGASGDLGDVLAMLGLA